MKFKIQRQLSKKHDKAQGRNAIELRQKISKAIGEGFTDYAKTLRKKGLRRGYAV